MVKTKTSTITSTVAQDSDGGVQITFSIPYAIIEKARAEALEELSKEVEVPGYRKGKAPKDKVNEKISSNLLLEKTLVRILPKALGKAIDEKKLKLAIYPKFELIKAKDNEPWEVRANTCVFPEVELGDYKKVVAGAVRASSIWTPNKGADSKKAKQTPSKEEKEQELIKALLEAVDVKIPSILIKEEADAKLSGLLSRLEKLGLNLDSYLASSGKTAEQLRKEYEEQAKGAIKLDLVLSKIAEKEGVEIKEGQIDEVIKVSGNEKDLDNPDQRRVIKSILARRAALDSLTALL